MTINKKTVILIEDEQELNLLVKKYLEKDNITVMNFFNAEDALEYLKNPEPFNMIILDLNLPGIDGFDFLRNFRKKNETIPVLIISAREEDEDIILSLGLGADEYVTKPFSPKVLVSRVQAIIRRFEQVNAGASDGAEGNEQDSVKFGSFTLLKLQRTLLFKQERVSISSKEFEILNLLSENINTPMSSYDIYEKIWGSDYTTDVATVGVYIKRIRDKIEKYAPEEQHIVTVHGQGYMLVN